MNQDDRSTAVATRQDIDDLSGAITLLANSVDKGFGQVNHRLDKVENRLDGVEGRLDNLETTANRMESKLDPTIEKVDDHTVRIRRLE